MKIKCIFARLKKTDYYPLLREEKLVKNSKRIGENTF